MFKEFFSFGDRAEKKERKNKTVKPLEQESRKVYSAPLRETRDVEEYENFWSDLVAENQTDYETHWTPERRKSFIEQAAEFLVDVKERGIATMVFMDKSARPLAPLLRAVWRRIYPDTPPPRNAFCSWGKIFV